MAKRRKNGAFSPSKGASQKRHNTDNAKGMSGTSSPSEVRPSGEVPRRLSKRALIFVFLLLAGICLGGGVYVLVRNVSFSEESNRLPQMPKGLKEGTQLFEKLSESRSAALNALKKSGGDDEAVREVAYLGQLYHANDFYSEAIQCYDLAIAMSPKDAKLYYLKADILQEKGENQSVYPLLARTVELASGYSPAILKIADNRYKTGKKAEAKAEYHRRLALLDNDPYALLGLARIAIDESQWDQAQKYLESAVASNPKFGNAHRMLATVHRHFGRKEKAEESETRAAECVRFMPAKDPWIESLYDFCYDSEKLLVVGNKAMWSRNLKLSFKLFYRALAIDPENPEAHMILGRLFLSMNKPGEAWKCFSKAAELNPSGDESFFQMGVILRERNQLIEAEKMFRKALGLNPNNPNAYNNLGVVLMREGRLVEAVDEFEKSLAIDPEHINARYNLASSLRALGRSGEALKAFYELIRLKPTFGDAADILAWILATDREKSIRNGTEALKYALLACEGEGKRNPSRLDTLAAAYAESGRFGDAVAKAQEAADLAKKEGETGLVADIEKRILLYRQGKPFRD